LPHQLREREQHLFEVGGVVVAVDLVEIDMVGAEPPEAVSTARTIQRREPPRWLASSLIGWKNLVAIARSSRRPLIALPTIVSDSPRE
jgi:hypothetical protein